MITLNKYSDKYNRNVLCFSGLKTDEKPTEIFETFPVVNGSLFYEIDTGKVYQFDEENKTWYIFNSNSISNQLDEIIEILRNK